MDKVSFTKMHGLGNDFVVLDDRDGRLALGEAEARAIGNRRRGVGFDQLLILEPAQHPDAHIFMRIRNPDGSEAEACGNGTRCAAVRIMDELGTNRLNVETVAGILETTRAADGLVTVNMGPAKLDWSDIPLAEPRDTLHLDISNGSLMDPVAVNIGNPHMVFFVEDVETIDLGTLGPELENHPLYPERTNVEVASLRGPDKSACGSGSEAPALRRPAGPVPVQSAWRPVGGA